MYWCAARLPGARRPPRSLNSPPRRPRMTDIDRRRGATFVALIALIALATVAAALSGCAVGPNYVKPATPVAPQFVGARAGAYSAEEAQTAFWTQFGDATLDRLIDDALDANHDLRI